MASKSATLCLHTDVALHYLWQSFLSISLLYRYTPKYKSRRALRAIDPSILKLYVSLLNSFVSKAPVPNLPQSSTKMETNENHCDFQRWKEVQTARADLLDTPFNIFRRRRTNRLIRHMEYKQAKVDQSPRLQHLVSDRLSKACPSSSSQLPCIRQGKR